MNFLSHYYFERYATHSEQVLGGLLPDLLKNVDKSYSFKLERYEDRFLAIPHAHYLSAGWHRHVEVDRIFHGADYFYQHTHALRKDIEHIVSDLPVRASFLAHIAFELLLDHKLIVDEVLQVESLYQHLEKVNKSILKSYLIQFELINIERFNTFYDKFVESRYIKDYAEIENIPHALFNICKRVWQFTPSTNHFEALAERLYIYQRDNMQDYMRIYEEIDHSLNMK